eukprot:1078916-Pelagomonas_calceolata.AAC.1
MRCCAANPAKLLAIKGRLIVDISMLYLSEFEQASTSRVVDKAHQGRQFAAGVCGQVEHASHLVHPPHCHPQPVPSSPSCASNPALQRHGNRTCRCSSMPGKVCFVASDTRTDTTGHKDKF